MRQNDFLLLLGYKAVPLSADEAKVITVVAAMTDEEITYASVTFKARKQSKFTGWFLTAYWLKINSSNSQSSSVKLFLKKLQKKKKPRLQKLCFHIFNL